MKKIKILGPGCERCNILYEKTEIAAKESGIEYTIEKVSGMNEIVAFGVLMTPALVVDGDVKFAGKVPDPEEIIEYIKN